jgi:hypothetical protein
MTRRNIFCSAGIVTEKPDGMARMAMFQERHQKKARW